MTQTKLKVAAKKHNAQIRKEIKAMQGGIVAGKNKNEWLLKQLSKLNN
jgi:hypothetical protein